MAKKKTSQRSTAKRKRRKIPQVIETEVLTECNYRCCACYQLDNDLRQKQGQIAHLDGNPGNNDKSNLMYLCHDHHSQYDSRSMQSKGLTEGFVRKAHERMREHFRLERRENVKIEITVNRDYDSFGEQERNQLIAELERVTNSAGGISKISVSRGSVKLHMEVSGEFLTKLLRAQEEGLLDELKITAIEYGKGKHGNVTFDPTFDCQLGVPKKEEVLRVVQDPDYVQPLLDRSRFIAELLVKDDWPQKGFATLVLFTSNTIVGRALLIPKSSLSSCPVERPRDLLKAFAERFCEPISLYGGEKIVFDKKFFSRNLADLGRALDFKAPLASLTYWDEPVIGGGVIDIAVFCKFGEPYVAELTAHGVQINVGKWMNRNRDWG